MLEHCRVVLVGAMFGGNVGASARAIKNTGLGPLHLVQPSYENDAEARMFSHGAEEVLESARRHETLIEAVKGCRRIVGFTVRERHRRAIRPLREFARDWVDEAVASAPSPTALVFGRERDGLRNEELDHCDELVWIPSHPEHPSYNLSQAVLLAGYELFQARLELDHAPPPARPRQTRRPPASPPVSAEDMAALQEHLRDAFLAIGYAQPHTVDALIRSYRELFARGRLQEREARLLRGLARQILWAADQVGGEIDGSEE